MPENMEDYVDFLKEIGRLDEAAKKLAYMVNRVCKGNAILFEACHGCIGRKTSFQNTESRIIK